MDKFKINSKLLPIKSHYFFFMAALGPILPQMSVYGKEMGISSMVMGTVTGILPLVFLIAKPAFGLLVDVYRDYRKAIFVALIAGMSLSFAALYIIPPRALAHIELQLPPCDMDTCNVTNPSTWCNTNNIDLICTSANHTEALHLRMDTANNFTKLCSKSNLTTVCDPFNFNETQTTWECLENIETSQMGCLYTSWTFWYFVVLMSLGMIGFNVANSISDAICFDVIGDDGDYGQQRVWGTIGYGITALIAGYCVDWASQDATGIASYAPAFLIMLIFTGCDLAACWRLRLPVMPSPVNIFKDLRVLLTSRHTIIFVTYSVFAGVLDGFIVYFFFWYLEDLALTSGTGQIKLIEGLIVAAETLGGEVIFFSIAGKILDRFGHAHAFSMCFVNYALRLGLISVVPSPWWAIPIEFALQGPTYALTYTTIVAYANAIAPPGASATMQGIAAGMDDGFGYAIGSLLGGFLYKSIGGTAAFQVFSCFALICSVSHLALYKFYLQPVGGAPEVSKISAQYKPTATCDADSTVNDINCI